MPGVTVFDKHVNEYEQWFVKNPMPTYRSSTRCGSFCRREGRASRSAWARAVLPPLGIATGIEPSPAMAELAGKRGIEVVKAVAEKLPFKDNEFDFALMVTTICFLDDLDLAFGEIRRVLKPGGSFIIGFVDKNSPLGKFYQSRQGKSVFYKDATFYSVDDILSHLKKAAFADAAFRQTIFRPLGEIEDAEPVKEGYGEGSFVVVRG